MTDFRTSQTFAGILADWDPTVRVSKHYVEILVDQDPTVRVSKHYVEVLADCDPTVRVTQYHLEVLYALVEIDLVLTQAETPIFPSYYPVPYGERWGHTE